MPYTPEKPPLPETPEQLRARIPGWGADLDSADRPAVPRERFDPGASGARWELPDQQEERWPRERSLEHARLTPVFGTSCPPKGLSGVIRKQAYARYSEGRAAHWLLLIAADRVDSVESTLTALASGRPGNPAAEMGLRAEVTHDGLRSRRGRVDARHHLLDPVVVTSPWVLGGAVGVPAVRRVLRRLP